jgi:C-terminal processing protease CtpA/Prc
MFAEFLAYDMRDLGKDLHFQVRYDPDFHANPAGNFLPTAEQLAVERQEMVRSGFWISRVEILPGNVGYLDLRSFGSTELVGSAYSSAMSLLSGTDALILDLRRNLGGDPGSEALMMSYFFEQGDERHLEDIYVRSKNETRQFWTSRPVGERYAKPVYILTSARTFSGAEACAMHFQTQKRGIVVGETTGGGANAGEDMPIGHGLVAVIPNGRSIDAVTHTDWERVGVKPDVAVPAVQALNTAYATILTNLIAKSKDTDESEELSDILERVKKGESEQPNYKSAIR